MGAAQQEQAKLHGTIEVDETHVGGKPKRGSNRGRRTPKEIVIAFGSVTVICGSSTLIMLRVARWQSTSARISSTDVDVVMTDDFSAYPKAIIAKAEVLGEHKSINHSLGVCSIGELHTNTVESAFSLLKGGIIGTWHKVSAKHLPAYLDEMSWRFNNRKNSYLFRDT